MRQYTLQLLLREDIFQNIDHLPDTMVSFVFTKTELKKLYSQDWISYFIENRLFLEHKHYSCQKESCNYVQIRMYYFI
jgi:hypothetical protein